MEEGKERGLEFLRSSRGGKKKTRQSERSCDGDWKKKKTLDFRFLFLPNKEKVVKVVLAALSGSRAAIAAAAGAAAAAAAKALAALAALGLGRWRGRRRSSSDAALVVNNVVACLFLFPLRRELQVRDERLGGHLWVSDGCRLSRSAACCKKRGEGEESEEKEQRRGAPRSRRHR